MQNKNVLLTYTWLFDVPWQINSSIWERYWQKKIAILIIPNLARMVVRNWCKPLCILTRVKLHSIHTICMTFQYLSHRSFCILNVTKNLAFYQQKTIQSSWKSLFISQSCPKYYIHYWTMQHIKKLKHLHGTDNALSVGKYLCLV